MKTQDMTEQAARWIEDVRRGTVSSEAFMAWLKESPKHVEALLMVATIESALHDLGQRDTLNALVGSIGANNTNVVPLTTESKMTPTSRGVTRRRWISAAAAAATVAAVALFWIYSHSEHVYTTLIGEQRTFELEDGSIVYLNADSKLEVQISASVRNLRLVEGEALFDVEHDPARPFRVLTQEAVIQAVGTQFNVHRRGNLTSVAVIEGRVNVLGDRLLSAGEAAAVSAGGHVKQTNSELERVAAWRERRLVFRNDALADIAAEFNRYNRRQTIRVDTAVGQRKFTGTFNADAPESLAKALSEDTALEVVTSDTRITVRAKGATQ